MALEKVDIDHSLQLKFIIGENEEGKDILRTRTLNRIRHTALDEDLYEIALELADLQKYNVASIVRNALVSYEEGL